MEEITSPVSAFLRASPFSHLRLQHHSECGSDGAIETFWKELGEIAERERALEEKLQAADRSVPKILEALEKKVSALAERQRELEGKLTPAKAV